MTLPSPSDTAWIALADPTRRTLLERLAAAPASVSDLAGGLPVSRSAVSQHLRLLKDAGMVRESRAGKFNVYAIEATAFGKLTAYLLCLSGNLGEESRTTENASPSSSAHTVDPANISTAAASDPVDDALALWPAMFPEQDPVTTGLSARILLIAHHLERALDNTASARGISGVEFMVLTTLKRLGPPFESTPTTLAKASLLSPPGMTKRLDNLEQLGMIERRPGQLDRRSVTVRLSVDGQRVVDDLIRKHGADVLPAFHLPREEQRQLDHALRQIHLRLAQRAQLSDTVSTADV